MPQRPKVCDYWFVEARPNPNHQRMFPYSELVQRAQPGNEIGYVCRYTDDNTVAEQGQFQYGTRTPPDAPVDNLALAQDLFREIQQRFLEPTVTSLPSLTNQRVGIETWLAVPTMIVPESVGDDDLRLHIKVEPAEFSVPVRHGPGRETFTCDKPGVGADGKPDGSCAHRFQYATNGTVDAQVSVTYVVTMSSSVTGEQYTPIGSVTRSASVPMNVKDLQATAR